MSRIATARWLSTCSICKGRILYGDKIVTYTDEWRGSSKKTHHLSPGCAPYTGKIVYVDSESTDLFDIKHRLRILKRINNVWAVEEISKIAKMSISPPWDQEPVEFEAFMHILLGWEKHIGTGGVLTKINEILQQAEREDIRLEAWKILTDWI